MSISKLTQVLASPFVELGNSVKTERKIAAIPGEVVAIVATTPATVAIGSFVGGIEGGLRALEPTSRTESLKVRDFVVPTATLRGTVVAMGTGALAATAFPAAAAMAQHFIGVDVGSTLATGAIAGLSVAMGWNAFVGGIKGAFDGLTATNGIRKAWGSATQCIANPVMRFLGIAATDTVHVAENLGHNTVELGREGLEQVRRGEVALTQEAEKVAEQRFERVNKPLDLRSIDSGTSFDHTKN